MPGHARNEFPGNPGNLDTAGHARTVLNRLWIWTSRVQIPSLTLYTCIFTHTFGSLITARSIRGSFAEGLTDRKVLEEADLPAVQAPKVELEALDPSFDL